MFIQRKDASSQDYWNSLFSELHIHDPATDATPTSGYDTPTSAHFHMDSTTPATPHHHDEDDHAHSVPPLDALDALSITLFVLLITLLYPTMRAGIGRKAFDKCLTRNQMMFGAMVLYLVCMGLAVWVAVMHAELGFHPVLMDFLMSLGIAANVYLVLNLMVSMYYKCCCGRQTRSDLESGANPVLRERRNVSVIEVPIPSYEDVVDVADGRVKTPPAGASEDAPPSYEEALANEAAARAV